MNKMKLAQLLVALSLTFFNSGCARSEKITGHIVFHHGQLLDLEQGRLTNKPSPDEIESIIDASLAPDGNTIACVADEGFVLLLKLNGKEIKRLPIKSGLQRVHWAKFSKRYLYYYSLNFTWIRELGKRADRHDDPTVFRYDLDTNETIEVFKGRTERIVSGFDSQRIQLISEEKLFDIAYDGKDPKLVWQAAPGERVIGLFNYYDGKHVGVQCAKNIKDGQGYDVIYQVDLTTGNAEEQFKNYPSSFRFNYPHDRVGVSTDGRHYFYSKSDKWGVTSIYARRVDKPGVEIRIFKPKPFFIRWFYSITPVEWYCPKPKPKP